MHRPVPSARKASLFNRKQKREAAMIKSNLVLLAAALVAASGAAAQTRDVTILAPTAPADALVQYVRYGDLNLTGAAGQARLEDRVRAAVDNVCPAGFALDLNAAAQSSACKVAAFTDARSQMDAAIAQASSGQLALAGSGGSLRIAARR
jgi:UrcA family protein